MGKRMADPIGIVGCSAEGAALCYRTICVEAPARLGRHAHPEVMLHTHSLADYVRCLETDDWAGVAELMLDSATKLERAGARFLICPDNTIHAALPLIADRSPLPWLPIAAAVARTAAGCGYRRLGITGTRWLVESEVYPRALEALGLDWVRPDEAARIAIDRIILEELVRGRFERRSAEALLAVVEAMRQAGCDAVILGCTELPLLLDAQDLAALPLLDSTRLLARAAIDRAIAPPRTEG